MLSYSVAIRTLGTAGEVFREELLSLGRQTVPPERVMIYIAEGFPRPDFQVGNEEYRWVRKGMMAQRMLPYDEIASDCILLLDDDVCLAPDSAEKLLSSLEEDGADCVGADVFRPQRMRPGTKLYAASVNLVFPHCSRTWAFRMHRNGSFSYLARPKREYYRSQTCGGPCSMWRKDAFLRLHLEDELWLDALGFPYGEDALVSYKLYRNGGRLGIRYDSGVENRDARSSSDRYRQDPDRFRIRSQALLMVWWRSLYRNGADTSISHLLTGTAFALKACWLMLVMAVSALVLLKPKVFYAHLRGLRGGWKAVHAASFRALRPYIF